MNELVCKYRRDLHQIPELDHDLPKTMAYIITNLSELSCEIIYPTTTSIAAFFDFHQADTFAYRSDMDALPIQEETNAIYASTHQGCMHACGHDAHMAMLLGFAQVVQGLDKAKHNVLLIFQPAEETSGGAKEIVESGIFQKYHTSAIFGIHVWSDLPKGLLASRPGAFMAHSSEVDIEIHGKSSHVARYQEGNDALQAGVSFLHEAYEIEANLPSSMPRLLKFGYMRSGTVRNAISNHTTMKGTLRTYDEKVSTQIRNSLKQSAAHIQSESGCTIQLHFSQGYPPLINDSTLFETCKNQLPQLSMIEHPSLLAEDFSFYGQVAPSVFFYLGTGTNIPLHSSTFDLDEAILMNGIKAYEMLLNIDAS